MNQPIPTGPDLFAFAEASYDKARSAGSDPDNPTFGSPEELYHFMAATFHAQQANTAALVMAVETFATASGAGHDDLDAWREKIGMTWLKECSRSRRRPRCSEFHTEDCPYSDPVVPQGTRVQLDKGASARWGTVDEQVRLASGKYRLHVQWDGAELDWVDQGDVVIVRHERLPVGTRVMVSNSMCRYQDGHTEIDKQPHAGKITGYPNNTNYSIATEYSPGVYSDHTEYVYMDERVQIHPDGPECPPKPVYKPRPAPTPTGPRVYVQDRRGKQGYILSVRHDDTDDSTWYYVQFLRPGVEPVYKRADSLSVIAESQVERCPNGQTGDECGSGENQCEPCVQADDEEGDEIERSMGLR